MSLAYTVTLIHNIAVKRYFPFCWNFWMKIALPFMLHPFTIMNFLPALHHVSLQCWNGILTYICMSYWMTGVQMAPKFISWPIDFFIGNWFTKCFISISHAKYSCKWHINIFLLNEANIFKFVTLRIKCCSLM